MRMLACSLVLAIALLAAPHAGQAGLSPPAVEVLTRDCLARFGSDLVQPCEVVTEVATLPGANVTSCLRLAASYDVDPATAQKLCAYYYQNP